MVEIMRVEMEQVLIEISSKDMNKQGNMHMQQEIIQKERRIFELQKKTQSNQNEILKLKDERD